MHLEELRPLHQTTAATPPIVIPRVESPQQHQPPVIAQRIETPPGASLERAANPGALSLSRMHLVGL